MTPVGLYDIYTALNHHRRQFYVVIVFKTTTRLYIRLTAFFQDYLGKPAPER